MTREVKNGDTIVEVIVSTMAWGGTHEVLVRTEEWRVKNITEKSYVLESPKHPSSKHNRRVLARDKFNVVESYVPTNNSSNMHITGLDGTSFVFPEDVAETEALMLHNMEQRAVALYTKVADDMNTFTIGVAQYKLTKAKAELN